jgi:hypothetical protein
MTIVLHGRVFVKEEMDFSRYVSHADILTGLLAFHFWYHIGFIASHL